MSNQHVYLVRMGKVPYAWVQRLMNVLVLARQREEIGDVLLTCEHPHVITLGRSGGTEDLLVPVGYLHHRGIAVVQTERGGRATYHGPGQLVVYPILKLKNNDVHSHLWRLEEVAIEVLASFGLRAERVEEYPGVWVGSDKVAAIGLAVCQRVTSHGIAINVDPDMQHFSYIVPCGIADRGVTSMRRLLGRKITIREVEQRVIDAFSRVFGCEVGPYQNPWPWLSLPAAQERTASVEQVIAQLDVNTVCQAALCPNITDCWSRGTATFMLLGNICTRGCRFCNVAGGKPHPPDALEPYRIAEAAARLNLQHIVITSVTRDDLPDGGATQFATAVRVLRSRLPNAVIEILVPDFGGSIRSLEIIAAARPDIFNHNIETVPRLTPSVRARASYRRSLGVLGWARQRGLVTKSGLMVGLGETCEEVINTMRDLRWMGVSILTIGQYLAPTPHHLPVYDYVHPALFAWYRDIAAALGFTRIAAAPLVRSSYHADELWSARAS